MYVIYHKEEATGRIKSDKSDRGKINDRSIMCNDVFDVSSHKGKSLVNIVT